jgi:hypothetical protein
VGRVPRQHLCPKGASACRGERCCCRGLSARLFLTSFLPSKLTRCAALSPPIPACPRLSQPVAACVGLCPLSGAARWAFGLGPRAAPGPVLRAPSNLRLSWPHCLTARDLHTYTPAAFENKAQNRGLGRLMLMQAFFLQGICSLALLLLAGQSSTPRRPHIVIRNSGPRTASSLDALPIVLLIDSTPNLPPSTCPSNSPQSTQLPSKQIPKMPSPDLC